MRSLALVLLAAASAVATSCGSFGEGNAPATNGGDGGTVTDAASADVPLEEPVVPAGTGIGSTGAFCSQKRLDTSVVFCSDFDDVVDEWAGWDKPDTAPSAYAIEQSEPHSKPKNALLTIKGDVGSAPSARLRRTLEIPSHVVLSGYVYLDSPNDTDAVLLRMQFDDGSLYVRSSGVVRESVKTDAGSENFTLLEKTSQPAPERTWFEAKLELDLPTGNFEVVVAGLTRTGQVRVKRRSAAKTMFVIGAFEPIRTSAPDLKVRYDDIVIVAK